jgi:Skp family chaperone for outer membrane proteins
MIKNATISAFIISFFVLISGCSPTTPGVTGDTPSSSSGSFPWSKSGLRMGYVRSDVISQQYRDYQDADNALQTENRKWLKEAEDMEIGIADKEKDLEELSLILSKDQKSKLENDLVETRKALQRFRHETWYDENSQYVKYRKEVMEPIDSRVNDAIWKVAEREELDVVFDTISGNIVYVKPEFDITNKVLEELQE